MHVYLPTLTRQSTPGTQTPNTWKSLSTIENSQRLLGGLHFSQPWMTLTMPPSWEPETESGGIKSTFLVLTRTFLVVDQKRIKWNNFTERRPRQKGVRVQKSINCWCLLNISGGSQLPLLPKTLPQSFPLQDMVSKAVLWYACVVVCVHICVYTFVCVQANYMPDI